MRWRLHRGTRGHVAVTLLLILAMAWVLGPSTQAQSTGGFALPAEGDLGGIAALAVADEPATPDELPSLEDIRDAHADWADQMPAPEWDIPALAAALDYDVERAFDFVRDSIAFDAYPGVLRGAEGALAARAGNAWDRALLLAALLDAMAVPTQLAVGSLGDEAAAVLLDRIALPASVPLPAPGIEIATALDADAISVRAARDYARLRTALGTRLPQTNGPDVASFAEDLRRHAWVQAAIGTTWVDLDPSLPDASVGDRLTDVTATLAEPPADALAMVTLRVVAESLESGSRTEAVVFDERLPAAAASARQLFMLFLPFDEKVGGAVASALGGDEQWVAALVDDGEVRTGTPFRTGGRGTDVFGDATDPAELVSLRIEAEVTTPGRPPAVGTRVLLDRVPLTLLADGVSSPEQLLPMPQLEGAPLALAQIHHVLVSTGGADRRDFAIQRSAAAEFVGAALVDDLPPEAYELGGLLWPIGAANQALVVASEASIVGSVGAPVFRSFVATPRVYLSSLGRDVVDGSMAYATDLLVDSVALFPIAPTTPGDASRRQLWYGALQTALETEIALDRMALLDPIDRVISAASLTSGALEVVGPDDLARLPGEIPRALRQALEDKVLAVVPTGAWPPRSWWTVAPETAQTRSIVDPGLGGAVPRGTAARSSRVNDASYSHGAGARLAPRQAAIRAPAGGPRYLGRPVAGACGPSDDLGYIPLLGCVSVQAALGFALVGMEVAFFVVLATYV